MRNKKRVALMWVLALAPAAAVALCWTRLPETIPTHWGLDGAVNGTGSRYTMWLLAALSPALAALFQFLPRIDPKRENYARFQGLYEGFAILIQAFLLGMTAIVLTECLRPGTLRVGRVTLVAAGVLFLAMGSLMGKVKSNWFMGFRTPWALSDPDVWNKTQRMGGWVFFLAGAVTVPLALLAPEAVAGGVLLGTLLLGTAGTYYMSWRWYRGRKS